jgi:myo-inositol 2-dehydrogenase / D-chiro-inositol 1-dehydrogenase
MTIKIGIIGTGGMGGRHAHNLHSKIPGASVAAVSDVDQARASQVAQECGAAKVFGKPLELIREQEVEAILIASPDATHAELTLECLRVGKPVLCEKPLASHAAAAKRVVEAEVALGKKLVAVGFMRRFDPEHVALKTAVQAGAIGQAILFKGVHRNAAISSQYRSEMGVSNSAVHDFDSARWLLGQEVESVYVRGLRSDPRLQENAFDLLSFQLNLSQQRLASIEVYVNAAYGYEVSAEVVGNQGTVITSEPARAVLRSKNSRSVPIAEDWLVRFQDAYVAELEHWLASLRGASFSGANAWDGYMSLLVADACIKSIASGQVEPVERAEKPGLYRS